MAGQRQALAADLPDLQRRLLLQHAREQRVLVLQLHLQLLLLAPEAQERPATGGTEEHKRDWLQPGLGYLRTSRARAKVVHWFKSQAREDNIDAGRHLLDREFKRLALTSVDYQRIARKVNMKTVEDMYAAVGAGDLSSAQVLNAAQGLVEKRPRPELRLARPGASSYRGQVR